MQVETLVVTDLDGTLWFDGEECHPSSLAAIDELKKSGVPLLIATGRRLRSVTDAFQRFELSDQAVLLNGSLGYCFEKSSNLLEYFLLVAPPLNKVAIPRISTIPTAPNNVKDIIFTNISENIILL